MALADQLPGDTTLIAPDLRGRGGSNGIAGPYGMPEHADDLVAVLDHLGVDSATVVGHSMGGFVAVVAADRHPDRVDAVLLVDGGLPLDLGPLAQLPIDELVAAIIGPSLQRLRMTFASAEEYLDFWRPHPALRSSWNPYIEEYLRYDLVGTEPELRSGVREEAVLADSESDLRDGVVERAVLALRHPVIFLRAPRGLSDADPLFAERDRRAVAGAGACARRPHGAGCQPLHDHPDRAGCDGDRRGPGGAARRATTALIRRCAAGTCRGRGRRGRRPRRGTRRRPTSATGRRRGCRRG